VKVKKKIFSIWSVLLVLVLVSIAVLVPGCDGDGADKYALTMAANPTTGGTATDETNGSPYEKDAVVEIKAVPADCYRFVSWSAPAGTFGNSTAAETTFTMPDRDVTVTANFELTPPDHFKFYGVDEETAPYVGKDVELVDQFGAFNVTVGYAISFGNPVQKIHNDDVTPISDSNRHLTIYDLEYEGEEEPPSWQVEVSNQFGESQQLTVIGPFWLAVPTQKEGHEEPVCLDHYLLYAVIDGPYMDVDVDLKDQFTEGVVVVGWAQIFANPVQKTLGSEVTEIEKEDEHLVFYALGVGDFEKNDVQIVNQFGPQTLDLHEEEMALLGVPSEKKDWRTQIDHFKCYELLPGPPPIGELVDLDDQFVNVSAANVAEAFWFCNPAKKLYEWPTPILDPDHHLMIYMLTNVETEGWHVTVQNQFGSEELTVTGPVALAVPTQKLVPEYHEPPVGLDHYLLYAVMGGTALQIPVGLIDEFSPEPDSVTVMEPAFFAIPVKKTHDGVVTDIENPMAHLVFYKITGSSVSYPVVRVVNQFDEVPFDYELLGPDMLAVPSLKVHYEVIPP
jgi:hypothetical protein